MKNILISTIVRNGEKHLNKWYENIKKLCLLDKNNTYYLSVYENDSTDNSVELLNKFDFYFLKDYKIISEKLNTPFFGSIINEERVKILSTARNKSIYNNKFLDQSSHVLVIEPDIDYNPDEILNNIINLPNYDVISPRSVETDRDPYCYLYDDWGTRKDSRDPHWTMFEPTILKNLGLINVWTTFNCLCLYNSEPFKRFLTFGYFNERFNKFDCDTAVICENFRKYGYSNIALNSSVEVYHAR